MVRKLQRSMQSGQDNYEGAMAHREQQRLNDILAQAESDRQNAEKPLNEGGRSTLRRAKDTASHAAQAQAVTGRFPEDAGAAS